MTLTHLIEELKKLEPKFGKCAVGIERDDHMLIEIEPCDIDTVPAKKIKDRLVKSSKPFVRLIDLNVPLSRAR